MSLTQRETGSSLFTNPDLLQNLRILNALTFDKSPIDFGGVFSSETSTAKIELTVHASTNLALTIIGEPHFHATLCQSVPHFIPGSTTVEEIPILVNQFVPKVDIVTDQDIVVLNPQLLNNETIVNTSIEAVQQLPQGGLQFQFTAQSSAPLTPKHTPITGAVPHTTPTINNKNTDFNNFRPLAHLDKNIDAASQFPYYIKVDFNAPQTINKPYGAVLKISYDDTVVEILLAAQTVEVDFTRQAGIPSVFLGDTIMPLYGGTNQSNMPAVITIPEQKPLNGIFIPAQSVNAAPNAFYSINLTIQTSTEFFLKGPVSFKVNWLVTYNNIASSVRKALIEISCLIKAPIVTLPQEIYALQGQITPFAVSIQSLGPSTTFGFSATGLPTGVTLQSGPVIVPGGKTITVGLSLQVPPHATITVKEGPSLAFTLLYDCYAGTIQDKLTAGLQIREGFKIQAQQKSKWCWAAVGCSVFAYYNGIIEQCTLVQKIKNYDVDPCGLPFPEKTNEGGPSQDALNFLGILKKFEAGALTQNAVISELDAGFPVVLTILWADTGGKKHAVAISGYVANSDGSVYFIVENPGNGSSTELYDIDALTNNYFIIGSWINTSTTQKPPEVIHVNTQNSVQ